MCRHFDTVGIGKSNEAAAQLFSVPDFVGDACKAIASRVRGAVASVQFDDFHKVSVFIRTVFIASSVNIYQSDDHLWIFNKLLAPVVYLVGSL